MGSLEGCTEGGCVHAARRDVALRAGRRVARRRWRRTGGVPPLRPSARDAGATHLRQHGWTAVLYREAFGLRRGASLCAPSADRATEAAWPGAVRDQLSAAGGTRGGSGDGPLGPSAGAVASRAADGQRSGGDATACWGADSLGAPAKLCSGSGAAARPLGRARLRRRSGGLPARRLRAPTPAGVGAGTRAGRWQHPDSTGAGRSRCHPPTPWRSRTRARAMGNVIRNVGHARVGVAGEVRELGWPTRMKRRPPRRAAAAADRQGEVSSAPGWRCVSAGVTDCEDARSVVRG